MPGLLSVLRACMCRDSLTWHLQAGVLPAALQVARGPRHEGHGQREGDAHETPSRCFHVHGVRIRRLFFGRRDPGNLPRTFRLLGRGCAGDDREQGSRQKDSQNRGSHLVSLQSALIDSTHAIRRPFQVWDY